MLALYLGSNAPGTNFGGYETLIGGQRVQFHANASVTYLSNATPWRLAQTHRALVGRVVVHWLATITPSVEGYVDAQPIETLKPWGRLSAG